jgi:GR25 family glycosyltransferase involved in LPS biosynthesis
MFDGEALNHLFPHIFVISIERNSSRRQLIEHQLKDCRFAYFEGVDAGKNGYDLNDLKQRFSELVTINDHLINNWSSGQTGCWLSHLSLLKKIVNEKLDRVLILEDDFIFDHANFERKTEALKKFDWSKTDMLYLGYTSVCAVNQRIKNPAIRNLYRVYYILKYYKKLPTFFLTSKTWKIVFGCFPKAIDKDFDRAGYFYGTHAYVVSYKGAQKLLQLFKEIKIPVDMSYAEAVVSGKLTGTALNQPLFFQNKELPSSIIS